MNRRTLVKQVLATVAVGAAAKAMMGDAADERNYKSATISVRLMEDEPGRTSVYLIEHGDADYVLVEAFYWTSFRDQPLMLHKEATTTLEKEITTVTDLPMALASIVFIRVKEMKLLNQSEFGKVPG